MPPKTGKSHGAGNKSKSSSSKSNSKTKSNDKAKKGKKPAVSDRQKAVRQQINDKANKFVSKGLNRIDIKKQLKEVTRQRALQPTPPPQTEETSATNGKDNKDKKGKGKFEKAKKNSKTSNKATQPTPNKDTSAATPILEQSTLPIHTIPTIYQSGRTLIVGDGDFSFTASLLQYRAADPFNILSTTYDNYQQVKNKYHDTYLKHLEYIHLGPAVVLNGIDATHLENHFPNQFTTQRYPKDIKPSPLQSVIKMPYPFDRVVFNFPHTGEQRVHINRALLLDFFTSVRPHLTLPEELVYPFGTQKEHIVQRKKLDQLLLNVSRGLLPYIVDIRKKYTAQQLISQQELRKHKEDEKKDTSKTNTHTPNTNHKDVNRYSDSFGRVIVVLRDGDPYDGWEIDVQAATALYQMEQKIPWDPKVWKFYHHKTTDISHNALEGGKAHIYIFKLTNVGIAMAIKEQIEKLHQIQSTRLDEHHNHHLKSMQESLANRTGLEQLLHLSPWQNRAIVKTQNKIKTALDKANHVSVGTLTSVDLNTFPNGSTKRSLQNIDDENCTQGNESGIAFEAFSAEKINLMTSRLNEFTMDDDEAQTAPTTKKTKKGKKEIETPIVPVTKKQKVDLSIVAGVGTKHRSMSLLDRLDDLVQISPLGAQKVSKKDAKKTISESTPSNDLFGQFNLSAILAMEEQVAPDVTQKRKQEEHDQKEFFKAAEIAKKEAEILSAEKAAKDAKETELLEQRKQEQREASLLQQQEAKQQAKQLAKDKKAGKFVEEVKVKAVSSDADSIFGPSDDVDLSREIFAMLNGASGMQDLAALRDLGDDGDESDENIAKKGKKGTSKSDLDKQFAAFKVHEDDDSDNDDYDYGMSDDDGDNFSDDSEEDKSIKSVTKSTKSRDSSLQALKDASKLLASTTSKTKINKATQSTSGEAPISSGFSGFGTGGIKTKTAEKTTETKKHISSIKKATKTPLDASTVVSTGFSGFGTGGMSSVSAKENKKADEKETIKYVSKISKTVKEDREPIKKAPIKKNKKVAIDHDGMDDFDSTMVPQDDDDLFSYGLADKDDLFPIKKKATAGKKTKKL